MHSIMYGFILHPKFSNDREGLSESLEGCVTLSKCGVEDGTIITLLFLGHLNKLNFLISTFANPLLACLWFLHPPSHHT